MNHNRTVNIWLKLFISLAICEKQVKTTLQFHLFSVRGAIARSKPQQKLAGEGTGERDHPHAAGENVSWPRLCEIQYGGS